MKVLSFTLLQWRPVAPRIRLFGPRRREARSAVLAGLILAIAAHLGLAAIAESRRPQLRDPEFFHRLRRLAVLEQWRSDRRETTPLLVIIGGSRPQMGLSPEVLTGQFGGEPMVPLCFNCCQSGSLPVGEALNLHRLLDAGITPDSVLIEVLPPVLADAGPMEERIPSVRLGAADLDHLRPYHENHDLARRRCLKERLTGWYSLRMPLRFHLGLETALPTDPASPHHLWSGMTAFGWGPFAPKEWGPAQRDHRVAAARTAYERIMTGFEIRPVNDRIYRDMLAECRYRGIRAALFTMPESPEFRKAYPPGVRERIARYLGTLAAEHGIPFFDTSEWVDYEEAFMDGHHLLAPVGTAFSERFGNECVKPWMARKP